MVTFKIATGQGDDYITERLLDYPYLEKYYKLIAKDLRKQQNLDPDPKATQQINFTRNLNIVAGATLFFTMEEANEKVSGFLKATATVKVL